MEKYLEETLFDLFERFEDYEDIINDLRSLNSLGELTDSEYNEILKNYDKELDKWLLLKDKEQAKKDNHKHTEELLKKTLTFLSSYLVDHNVGYYDEIDIYKKIGFTKKDMEKYGLIDPELEREIKHFEVGE